MRGIGGGRGRGKEVSLCHRDSTGVGCSPAWMSSHKEGILLPHRASLQRKGFSSPQAPKYHPAGSVPHPIWALCHKEGVPLPHEASPIRERSQCFTKHHPTGMRSSPACREGVPSPRQMSSHREGVPLPQETTPGRDGCLCLTENCPQEASPIRKEVPKSHQTLTHRDRILFYLQKTDPVTPSGTIPQGRGPIAPQSITSQGWVPFSSQTSPHKDPIAPQFRKGNFQALLLGKKIPELWDIPGLSSWTAVEWKTSWGSLGTGS